MTKREQTTVAEGAIFFIRAAEELDKLICEAIKNTKGNNFSLRSKVNRFTASALIQFSEDEIEQMGELFKELFRAGGGVARIQKNQKGKRKPTYEIRYRRCGCNIFVTDKDIKRAKKLFIKATFNCVQDLKKPEIKKGANL